MLAVASKKAASVPQLEEVIQRLNTAEHSLSNAESEIKSLKSLMAAKVSPYRNPSTACHEY